MSNKDKNNPSNSTFFDNSELSLKEKNHENSFCANIRTNMTDKKQSNANSNNFNTVERKFTANNPESPLQKQMSKSDAQSLDRNSSMQNTEKEFSSPSSPLRKLMGALGKGINNLGKNIGSGINNIGKGIGKAGQGGLNVLGRNLNNLGSALKLNQLGKGLNMVSNGLGLNRLGKGIGLVGKQGLKGLNSLSKGLGLDMLGKGLNNLSKLGLDQLNKGLKDISKGLNLRKLQENLKKIA